MKNDGTKTHQLSGDPLSDKKEAECSQQSGEYHRLCHVYGRILCGSGMGCDSDFQRIADLRDIDSFSTDHRADPGAVPKYFRLIPQYYSMIGSAERLMDLEQIEEEEAFSVEEEFEKISEEMQAIVFEEVGFSYENRSVLEHFSVRLEKGSLTAVAGPSGAGKAR